MDQVRKMSQSVKNMLVTIARREWTQLAILRILKLQEERNFKEAQAKDRGETDFLPPDDREQTMIESLLLDTAKDSESLTSSSLALLGNLRLILRDNIISSLNNIVGSQMTPQMKNCLRLGPLFGPHWIDPDCASSVVDAIEKKITKQKENKVAVVRAPTFSSSARRNYQGYQGPKVGHGKTLQQPKQPFRKPDPPSRMGVSSGKPAARSHPYGSPGQPRRGQGQRGQGSDRTRGHVKGQPNRP